MLLVDNEGRTFPVRGFRVIVGFALVFMLLAGGAAISAFWLYGQAFEKINIQTAQLSESRRKASVLRQEKEELMARLVLSREISDSTESPSVPDDAVEEIGSEAPDLIDITPDVLQAPEVTQESESIEEAPSVIQTQFIRKVQVEDFKVSSDESGQLVSVQFIIRKIEFEEQAVSGYGFVILKPEPSGSEDWLVFPTVKLKSGVPEITRRGQFFSISRFKFMRFEKKVVDSLDRFELATVLIYDTEGQLLVERNFPVGPIEVADEIDG